MAFNFQHGYTNDSDWFIALSYKMCLQIQSEWNLNADIAYLITYVKYTISKAKQQKETSQSTAA